MHGTTPEKCSKSRKHITKRSVNTNHAAGFANNVRNLEHFSNSVFRSQLGVRRISCHTVLSTMMDVELEEKTPPDVLWHGTGEKYVDSIDAQGLIPKSRLYVHLSSDVETAMKVGSRHGRPDIYEIDCKQMSQDGYRFFESANHVWLTKEVPVKYLKRSSKMCF